MHRLSPYFQTTPQQVNQPFPLADDVYRPNMPRSLFETPGSTPGTDGSQAEQFTAEPALSTDDYEVEETPTEPASGSRKGKGKAQSSTAPEAPKRTRTTYTLPESALIADCWVDTSEDAQVSNYQTEILFWSKVAEKYNRNKTPSMTDHGSEAIRRHWERLLKECGQFNGIYQNLLNNMPSGQNEAMVRDEAISKFCGLHLKSCFKYWDVYQRLKDIPKFQTGMHVALHGRSQRSRLSIDLTTVGPYQRPEGTRTARRKGKGKGSSSQATEAQSEAVDLQKATFSTDTANLTQLMTL